METLSGWGLAAVVDLRSELELSLAPNQTPLPKGVRYYHVSMQDHVQSDLDKGIENMFPPSLTHMYQDFLSGSKAALREVFQIFAKEEGGVYFHCAVGKDRTGMVAALLLLLAGAGAEMAAEDYAFSAPLSDYVALGIYSPIIPGQFFESPKEVMHGVLNSLLNEYGSVEAYLAHIGVTEEEMRKIKRKFL